jgi:hypothetical protein
MQDCLQWRFYVAFLFLLFNGTCVERAGRIRLSGANENMQQIGADKGLVQYDWTSLLAPW